LAVAFGGENGTNPITSTELWNGTSWTSNPTGLSQGRARSGSAGTQAAALAFGGTNPTVQIGTTEEWNTQLLSTKTITVS